jgi:biopolymer transport protein ExbB
VDPLAIRRTLVKALESGNAAAAATMLQSTGESMEVRVVSYGLKNLHRGHRPAKELMTSAQDWESARYDRYLWFLATLGNNSPFFGLFGTVLGVIMAFDALGAGTKAAGGGSAVMGPIAEALIATAVGLLVAIPAVLAFNIFKVRAAHSVANTRMLAQTLLAFSSHGHLRIAHPVPSPATAAGLARGKGPTSQAGQRLNPKAKDSKNKAAKKGGSAPAAVAAAPAAAAPVAAAPAAPVAAAPVEPSAPSADVEVAPAPEPAESNIAPQDRPTPPAGTPAVEGGPDRTESVTPVSNKAVE